MSRVLSTVLVLAVAVCAVPAPVCAQDTRPVKVYILSGQSNMVGFGQVTGPEPGTLETLTGAGMFPHMVDGAGNWTVRDDVRYKGVVTATADKWLTVGCGAHADKFGPELGFGHVVGDYHDEPVLLIKSSQGNRSLGWDFLPPGSQRYTFNGRTYAGYGDEDDSWTDTDPYDPNDQPDWYAGKQYDDCVAAAKNVLNNFNTSFPQWADRGYEIAGFGWWQGHKDQGEPYASRYEQNMVQFIKQLRGEFDAPDAPFVLSTIAFDGWDLAGAGLTVANAQLAVSGETGNYPEFTDNVRTVEARDYWRDADVSPSTQGYHYNWNAETFMRVGDAMGQAMTELYVERPFVTVDQQTGEIKIVNPSYGGLPMDLEGYSVTSEAGALDESSWTAIAGHYDLAGDGSVDDDGYWTVLTATNGQLTEEAEAGGGDGLIVIDSEVSLGVGAWIQNPTKDLVFTYTDTDGVERQLSVRYVGTDTVPADLDFDGTVEADDWQIFIAGNQADLSALSQAEAYQMGDLDGDGDNDIYDFDLFRQAYELDNPAPGAFDALVAEYPVPEPASILLLAAGAAGLAIRRRRTPPALHADSKESSPTTQPTPSADARHHAGLILILAAALCGATTAGAATMNISSSAPTVDGLDIANLVTPTGGQLIWSDRSVQGQTFTTGSQWGTLTAVTVRLYEAPANAPIDGWKDYSVRVGTVALGDPDTLDVIVSETARQNPDAPADSYVTFALDSPVTLSPNTLYGFDVGLVGSQEGWQAGIPQVRTRGNEYAGGRRYSGGHASNPGTTLNLQSDDLIFHADIAPLPASAFLTLQVNTISGATTLLGSSINEIDINYYEVTSAGHSLDEENWLSLTDQDFEGNGPPDGSGDGWEEAGGAGPHALAEAYLLGESTIPVDAEIGLGAGYDPSVDAQDLVFNYRTGSGYIFEGNVEYVIPEPATLALLGLGGLGTLCARRRRQP